MPIEGATVDLLARNTTTPVLDTTTTSAAGYWAFSYATEGRYDVRITNGSSVRWHMYDASAQFTALEVQTLRVRNPAFTFEYDIVPGAITADRQLNLPVITGTDTLMTLGLAQAITAAKTFNDSVALTFGTGGDATIQYDGTNQLYNSLVVGTGYHGFTGDISVANGYGLIVGHTAQVSAAGDTSEVQVLGTAAADASTILGRWSADVNGPVAYFVKSRNATIGSFTIVADDDILGVLRAVADDGTDYVTTLADIIFEVDDASPATSDIGAAVVVRTHPGGGNPDGIREVWRWDAAGNSIARASAVLGSSGTGASGMVLKNLKNASASALSGTQLDIEIDIGGTPYYFTVYPTKA